MKLLKGQSSEILISFLTYIDRPRPGYELLPNFIIQNQDKDIEDKDEEDKIVQRMKWMKWMKLQIRP